MTDITYTAFPNNIRKKHRMEIKGDQDKYSKALKILGARRGNYFDGWTLDVAKENDLKDLIQKLGGNPENQKTIITEPYMAMPSNLQSLDKDDKDDSKIKEISKADAPKENTNIEEKVEKVKHVYKKEVCNDSSESDDNESEEVDEESDNDNDVVNVNESGNDDESNDSESDDSEKDDSEKDDNESGKESDQSESRYHHHNKRYNKNDKP